MEKTTKNISDHQNHLNFQHKQPSCDKKTALIQPQTCITKSDTLTADLKGSETPDVLQFTVKPVPPLHVFLSDCKCKQKLWAAHNCTTLDKSKAFRKTFSEMLKCIYSFIFHQVKSDITDA